MASRLPSTRANKPSHDASLRPAPIGDNSGAMEEAERIQFISIISKLSAADDLIVAARGPYDAAKDARKKIVGLGKAAGFKADDLEKRLKEMKMGVREAAQMVATERKQRRWGGIIDADQESLMLGDQAPQSAKDEAHFAGEGYKAGLRQMPPKAPPGCTGLNEQAFLRGHERGWSEILMANAPKKLEPTVREKAAADFATDNPEPEPGSPAAKKAERAAIAKAKASLDSMQGGDATADTVPAGPDDGFTLSDEELAAQAGRRQPEEADVV